MSLEKLTSESFYVGNQANSSQRLNNRPAEEEKFNGKSVNAANLNILRDDVTEKQIKANKEAMKIILETFASQSSIDDEISSMKAEVQELRQNMKNTEQQQIEMETNQEELLKKYGIDKDSQEYQDFELLAKKQFYDKRNMDVLSEEEKGRIASMGDTTDFQKQALFNADVIDECNINMDNYQKEMMGIVGSVKGINQELLKSDPMVKSKKIAENIVKSANQEVIGMLIEEAKDHIDEAKEEEAKEAEAAEKEKEELEERIEAAKPDETKKDKKDAADINMNNDIINTEGFAKADEIQQKLENEIKIMLLKQKITNDDIKGIAVDEQR